MTDQQNQEWLYENIGNFIKNVGSFSIFVPQRGRLDIYATFIVHLLCARACTGHLKFKKEKAHSSLLWNYHLVVATK